MPSSNIGVKAFSNKGTMLSWAKPSCLRALPLNSTTMASYTSSRVIISKRLWFIELVTLQGTLFCHEVLHLFVGAGGVVTIGNAKSSIHTSWCCLLNGRLTYPSISRKKDWYVQKHSFWVPCSILQRVQSPQNIFNMFMNLYFKILIHSQLKIDLLNIIIQLLSNILVA
jgi:hypothetical protein